MIWVWGFFFFIVLMAISLGIKYAIDVRRIGRESAQRDLRDSPYYILVHCDIIKKTR
jgi:hypothetical protein